jgi:uncharacterized protein (TIGR02452 family)
MAKRSIRAQVAQETVSILDQGWYVRPTGPTVSIAAELDSARSRSVLYSPADFGDVYHRRDQVLRARSKAPEVEFEVINETTLHAGRRLLLELGHTRILALNFASAWQPGGGFLNGSQAQEESLARASGIYACLSQFPQMYDVHRQSRSCLYTDHIIYAPDVPVFRDDEDGLLEVPFPVSFLTAPAVNASSVRTKEPENIAQIEPVMRSRTEKVLSLAVVHGHEVIVLGAWGCGVFGNNPVEVARWFAEVLTGDGLFRAAFRRVIFAVLDRSPDRATIRAFEDQFG